MKKIIKKLTIHPYSVGKKAIYQIDQSGKIEQTSLEKPTKNPPFSEFFDESHTDVVATSLRCLYHTKYTSKC